MAAVSRPRKVKRSRNELIQLQSLDLDAKIQVAKNRIQTWYKFHDGDVYVAFSGGKDSTVLLHLVRSMYPNVPAVFFDTGVEFPEIRAFVKATPNVKLIRPTMTFKQVLEKQGYPVISKRIAQYVSEVQRSRGETATKHLRLTGFKTDGTFSKMGHIPKKWLFLCDAPFMISDKCCKVFKKKPAYAYEDETGEKPFIGTMAVDSQQRELTWIQYGCNALEATRPTSKPLSIWTEQDAWDYLHRFEVPYSSIYDKGYARTGCVFCLFGIHMQGENHRFKQLAQTHPAMWRYAMDKLGYRAVFEYLKIDPGEPAPHVDDPFEGEEG